jgi:uncharacterized metal-binding protein YceD (DUF177 family)
VYKVNLSPILGELGRKMAINEILTLNYEATEGQISGPVKAELVATNLGKEVLVSGKIAAELQLRCFRCNEFFPYHLQADFEEEYRREEDLFQFSKEDYRIGRDDLIFILNQRGDIDLEEPIKQAIILNLPLTQACGNCQEAVRRTF